MGVFADSGCLRGLRGFLVLGALRCLGVSDWFPQPFRLGFWGE
jgi:hypothetical protein